MERFYKNVSTEERSFPTRTAFFGHWKKKNGGWLAECNKERKKPFLVEDFDIIDLQENANIGMAINIVNTTIDSVLSALGTKKYYLDLTNSTTKHENWGN